MRSVDLAHERPGSWFYIGMGVAVVVTVFVAFHRPFYLRPSTLPPLAPFVVAHATIFSAWVVLFVTQTTLVAANRVQCTASWGWPRSAWPP